MVHRLVHVGVDKVDDIGAAGIGAPLALSELMFSVELSFWVELRTEIAGECILSKFSLRFRLQD